MILINTYSNVGQTDIDNMQLVTDDQRRGYHQVTLTEMDTTTIPQVAAGSMAEVGGALYEAQSNESISGSASTGTNYIKLVPGTGVVTPTWTTTAPTWSDAKQGWYGTVASAGHRYLNFSMEYDGASAYTNKRYEIGQGTSRYPQIYSDGSIISYRQIFSDATERTQAGVFTGNETNLTATFDVKNGLMYEIKFLFEAKASSSATDAFISVDQSTGSADLYYPIPSADTFFSSRYGARLQTNNSYAKASFSFYVIGTTDETISIQMFWVISSGYTIYAKNRHFIVEMIGNNDI